MDFDFLIVLVENALRGLKEQKDQYRLYHISQDVQSLQKSIAQICSMLRKGNSVPQMMNSSKMNAPQAHYNEPKPPMAVINMNPKVEEEPPKVIRKQAPLTTQEENIRRALRDYYAKK